MKIKYILFIVSFAILQVFQPVISQQTAYYSNPNYDYKTAVDLFEKENYTAAMELFDKIKTSISNNEDIMYASCEFHIAVCAYKLLNNDAEYKLTNFINNYSENSRTSSARLYLANLYYRDKKYKKAIELYKNIDNTMLHADEQDEFFFKIGHSAFLEDDLNTSSFYFTKIKDNQSIYAPYATYYFAHIAYEEKNYNIALEHFNKLSNNQTFKNFTPYYISQILYYQQKYDELAVYIEPLLKQTSVTRLPEILKLAAEAYFNMQQYDKSLPFFEKYSELSPKLTPEEQYKIGYAYYRTQAYNKAIVPFQEATNANDSLAQNAHYHLGYCYIQTNNKQLARTSFHQAYKIHSNKLIAEDALFHFAKLSYELGINPYNEAITAIMDYIERYPNSYRIDEAYEYLVNLYFQTKNYKGAIESIEKVKKPNEKLNMVYQKITYFRGVELFNDKKYKEAINIFDKSLKHTYDSQLRTQVLFWKAEAQYQLREYDNAIKGYTIYLGTPGAFGSDLYSKAHYNLGYCYYNKKQYNQALTHFRTFIEGSKQKNTTIVYDAYLRQGDCLYAVQRYKEAISSYEKVIKPDFAFADYALLQKGLTKGILSEHNGKISDLNEFIKQYPKSPYMADAIYELANTYLIVQNTNKAIEYFEKIITNYPNSSYRVKSMLKIGMTYYNTGNSTKALSLLKQVSKEYSGTPEAKEALVIMRNIYTEENKVEDFFVYVQEMSGSTVAVTEQDTITYIAAENAYMKNDCVQARKGFENYLKNFPNGQFVANAYFYKAECDYQAERYNDALIGYEYIILEKWSKFSETSLLKAARIHFSSKNWNKANEYFTLLKNKAEYPENIQIGHVGQMRALYEAKNYAKAIQSAETLIEAKKTEEEHIIEARSIIGKSAYEVEDISKAISTFNQQKNLKSEYGAEAFYYIALIQHKLGHYEDSEKFIFELINTLPSYEYWIAKSFILLSDNYIATDNIFQAKHTLKSVIENYEGEELVGLALQKLKEIEKKEKENEINQIPIIVEPEEEYQEPNED